MLACVHFSYPAPDLTDGVVRLRRWEHRDRECVRLAATDPRKNHFNASVAA